MHDSRMALNLTNTEVMMVRRCTHRLCLLHVMHDSRMALNLTNVEVIKVYRCTHSLCPSHVTHDSRMTLNLTNTEIMKVHRGTQSVHSTCHVSQQTGFEPDQHWGHEGVSLHTVCACDMSCMTAEWH